MSFRKRSVVLTGSPNPNNSNPSQSQGTTTEEHPAPPPPPGIRPSPLTGVPTTSTGTASLDALFSGHAGLPLGSLILIEESSTTDFAGALLRYFAAEGIVQGHEVLVVGVGEGWGRELPGLSERREDNEDLKRKGTGEERMKIAWRYEILGNRREAAPAPTSTATSTSSTSSAAVFCHTYDLTKRLLIPPTSKPPIYIPPPSPFSPSSPFQPILSQITTLLSIPSTVPTRIVIPHLLSPLLYPTTASQPTHILPFIHSLRSLTRIHANRLTIMLSLSISLYPRSSSGLVRQIEHLTDATIELHPVPAFMERAEMRKGSGGSSSDDVPQGLVKVWKMVEGKKGTGIIASRGSSGNEAGVGVGMEGGDDLAFMLTRRRMRIERFSLPVDDGDDGGGEEEERKKKRNPSSSVGEGVVGKAMKVDLEF